VLTDPRQVEHERLLVARLDLLLDPAGQRIFMDPLGGAGEIVVPVGPPADLLQRLAGQLRARASDRIVLGQRRRDQLLVVISPRLVVVVDLRKIRV
jgi:hypothetical protein